MEEKVDMEEREGEEGEGHEAESDDNEDENDETRKMEVWKCQRLKLTSRAREILFSNACLWATDQSNTVALDNSSHLAFLTSSTNLLNLTPKKKAAAGNNLGNTLDENTNTDHNNKMDEERSNDCALDEKEHSSEKAENNPEHSGKPSHTPLKLQRNTPLSFFKQPGGNKGPISILNKAGMVGQSSEPSSPASVLYSPLTPLPMETNSALKVPGYEKKVLLNIGITSVELVLYPMGCGLLVFHIDWLGKVKKVSLDEIRR